MFWGFIMHLLLHGVRLALVYNLPQKLGQYLILLHKSRALAPNIRAKDPKLINMHTCEHAALVYDAHLQPDPGGAMGDGQEEFGAAANADRGTCAGSCCIPLCPVPCTAAALCEHVR